MKPLFSRLPSRLTALLAGALALGSLTGLTGCRGETSRDAPIVPIRNMYGQPRYNIQSESLFFGDHRTMRPPVENTVSREMETDPEIAEGRLWDGSGYVLTIPPEVVSRAGGLETLVERGQNRFNIYCVPCHSRTGSGDGIVVKHGMGPHPTSFHDDRLRHAPDGQIYATIENGIRNMPAYGPQIPVADRWAIVSYVRALQLSGPEIYVAEKKP